MSPVKEDFMVQGINASATVNACIVRSFGHAGFGISDKEGWQRSDSDLGALRETVEMVGIRTPSWLTRGQEIKMAQVQLYEPALKILAELYDKVAVPVSSLANDKNASTVIAVAMLAAAGLCDVSPAAIRLSPDGRDFVELLKGDHAAANVEA